MNLAIARRFAEHGARLAIMSRDPDRVAKPRPSCVRQSRLRGHRHRRRRARLRRGGGRRTRAAEAFGGLDVAVAGQAGNFYASATRISSNGFKAVVEIDLVGTFHLFRAATSSCAGRVPR
jgi:NAD(P)-dependent dehydrogenase (short-subunit alcohol dehydrogenase family)